MKTGKNMFFLYGGLVLLLVALIAYWLGASINFYLPALIVAVLLKVVFLVNIFRSKELKMSLGLALILSGVVLILLSLLFKSIVPIPLLRYVLFYMAIALKVTGLLFLLAGEKKKE